MQLNSSKKRKVKTHEGANACLVNSKEQLKRAVMSCMLWENQFYEDGVSIADRIEELVPKLKKEDLEQITIEAREKMHLRHVPLLLCAIMSKHKLLNATLLERIIQRADELSEFLSIYWRNGKCPLASQVKKGLAKAFNKFSEYQLAKYNRDKAIKLRDVLFLCHAKPKDKEQEVLWKKLVDNKLETPDTWEVILSDSTDKRSKKEKWEWLLTNKKVPGMALLRNLRNLIQENGDRDLIKESLKEMNTSRILPFRFISAAKHAPELEEFIEKSIFKSLKKREKLPGKTILVVDVSGSMYGSSISNYSELDRAKTACSLAILVREICDNPVIYATAGDDSTRIHNTRLVPSRRGFALSDFIYNLCNPLGGGGIFLKQVMDFIYNKEKDADRIIVITDEQDCDVNNSPNSAKAFGKKNYIINIASYDRGISYGKFIHINGWSNAVIDYILEYEKLCKKV